MTNHMLLNFKSNIKINILWPTSYKIHVRRKERVKEPLKFVASCGPQVLSTHDKKNSLKQSCQEQFEMSILLEYPNELIL
jgi:hypothetical protein